MSIRSQNKKVNVNFQRKLSTHNFHETEFHEISFNKYLEKHSKTCLPNLSIHGLYSIISHRQYSISQYSLPFLSLYKLHFHITRSYYSTTHLENHLRKPVTQVTKSSNLRIIPQSQYSILILQMVNVNFQRKVSIK